MNENREDPGQDGSQRKAHYGSGRQPWDDIKDLGWAPEFAAASILKYLRRTKDKEHSIESARWYWERLHELEMECYPRAQSVLFALTEQLTGQEHFLLAGE